VPAGISVVRVPGVLSAVDYVMRVTATRPDGAIATDQTSFFGGRSLPVGAVRRGTDEQTYGDDGGGTYVRRCVRWGERRVDCEIGLRVYSLRSGRKLSDTCSQITAVTLEASGIAFQRDYGCRRRSHGAFRLRPRWIFPAERFAGRL
jgi:hypothetical protein